MKLSGLWRQKVSVAVSGPPASSAWPDTTRTPPRTERIRMLHYTAIFDGYGLGFEFAPDAFVANHNNMRTYQTHPRWETEPGTYSDDTQMQVALAELMLQKPRPSTWTPYDVARAFLDTFKRDPRKGYAGSFYDFMVKAKSPWAFLEGIRPHSDKSGGAMRAPVIGLLPDEQQVIDTAMFQASLTHATQNGMEAAAAAALLTHYIYHQIGPKAEVGKWIERRLPGMPWSDGWNQRIESPGYQHVMAAIGMVQTYDSASTLLQSLVALTGDVDTAAAICAPAAYYSPEITNDIPDSLILATEDGAYGFGYLFDLGEKLEAQFPRQTPDPILDLFEG